MPAFRKGFKLTVRKLCRNVLPLFNACGKYRAVGVHNNYGHVNGGQYARKIAGKVIRINCCRNPWRQFAEFLNYPIGSGRAFAVFKNIVGKGFKIRFAVIRKALGNNVKTVHIVAVQYESTIGPPIDQPITTASFKSR